MQPVNKWATPKVTIIYKFIHSYSKPSVSLNPLQTWWTNSSSKDFNVIPT